MAEVLVLLVAFFLGPIGDHEPGFMFYEPSFSDKESCNQYIIENKSWLHIYLSGRWGTLPDVYESKLICMTGDELKDFQKHFDHKSSKQISI